MRGCTRWLFVVGLLCTVVGTAAANDYFPQSVASGDPTADSVCDAILEAVDAFTNGEPLQDDATLLVVERLSS